VITLLNTKLSSIVTLAVGLFFPLTKYKQPATPFASLNDVSFGTGQTSFVFAVVLHVSLKEGSGVESQVKFFIVQQTSSEASLFGVLLKLKTHSASCLLDARVCLSVVKQIHAG